MYCPPVNKSDRLVLPKYEYMLSIIFVSLRSKNEEYPWK